MLRRAIQARWLEWNGNFIKLVTGKNQDSNSIKDNNMKKYFSLLLAALISAFVLPGCEVIGDIFEAGIWVGVIVVVGIIALVIWLIAKLGGRK